VENDKNEEEWNKRKLTKRSELKKRKITERNDWEWPHNHRTLETEINENQKMENHKKRSERNKNCKNMKRNKRNIINW
jgi:hypothetical protein